MTEQAPSDVPPAPHENVPPPSPADRVRRSIVDFLKSRLPGEKTRKTMKTFDKILPHLTPEIQEHAARLRPAIETSLYAGNVVGTTAEIMLAASAALGGVLLAKEALSRLPIVSKHKSQGDKLIALAAKKAQPEQPAGARDQRIARFLKSLGTPSPTEHYWKLEWFFRTDEVSHLGDNISTSPDTLYDFPRSWFNGPAGKAFFDDANAAWKAAGPSLGFNEAKKSEFALLLENIFDMIIMKSHFDGEQTKIFKEVEKITTLLEQGKLHNDPWSTNPVIKNFQDHVFGENNQRNTWNKDNWFIDA